MSAPITQLQLVATWAWAVSRFGDPRSARFQRCRPLPPPLAARWQCWFRAISLLFNCLLRVRRCRGGNVPPVPTSHPLRRVTHTPGDRHMFPSLSGHAWECKVGMPSWWFATRLHSSTAQQHMYLHMSTVLGVHRALLSPRERAQSRRTSILKPPCAARTPPRAQTTAKPPDPLHAFDAPLQPSFPLAPGPCMLS